MRKEPMKKTGFNKMIMKFEDIGGLGLQRMRRRKQIVIETVEEVATAVIERDSSSSYFSTSARAGSRKRAWSTLLPWSTV